MIPFFKDNSYFFILSLLYIIFGGILLFNIEKSDAIFYFSERRSALGDFFFRYVTRMGELAGYLSLILIFLFVRIRYAMLIPITALVVLLISYPAKRFFLHDRPALFFKKLGILDEVNLIDQVYLLSGTTSFPSGHTISAFALYGISAFFLSKRKWLGIPFFMMAFGVALSRVYLVQHFFEDVYAGGIIGILTAIMVYFIQLRIPYNPENRWDQPFFNKKKKRPQA